MSSTNTSCLFSDSCFTWSVIAANFWLALSWSSTSLCRLMGIRNVQRGFSSAKPLAEENGISSVEKLPGTLAGRMTITSALMPSPLHASPCLVPRAKKKHRCPKDCIRTNRYDEEHHQYSFPHKRVPLHQQCKSSLSTSATITPADFCRTEKASGNWTQVDPTSQSKQ